MEPILLARKKEQKSSPLTSLVKWLELKRYQLEVTLSLYMLTGVEKIVFYVIVLTLASLFVTALYYYLPNHMYIIYNRVYYYAVGDFHGMTSTPGGSIEQAGRLIKETAGQVATSLHEEL